VVAGVALWWVLRMRRRRAERLVEAASARERDEP